MKALFREIWKTNFLLNLPLIALCFSSPALGGKEDSKKALANEASSKTSSKHGDAEKRGDSKRNLILDHRKAYQPVPGRGEHLEIKITPPEGRGQEGKILVEVYNNSNLNLSSVSFDIEIDNDGWETLHSHITVEDLIPQWSDVKWIEIKGKAKIPNAKQIKLRNMKIYTSDAKKIDLKYYTTLIKK